MFIDRRYACCTINLVRQEVFRTQKFKTKYPWRNEYKDKIRGLPNNLVENNNVDRYFDTITNLIDHGILNKKRGVDFDFSYIDKKILSCALGNGYNITTGDTDIKDFALQQFGKEFKGWISTLGMLNVWIRNKMIEWNDRNYEYVTDWKRDDEAPQPRYQQKLFKKLTERNYPGS